MKFQETYTPAYRAKAIKLILEQGLILGRGYDALR